MKCTACQWYCQIPEGFVGVCGVRANVKGKLKLLVDGRVSSVAIDPIEKKPLYHFLPGSQILSLGTVGCNFSCKFCQNWQISQTPKLKRNELLVEKVDKKRFFPELKQWIESVTQPLSPKEAVELAKKYKTPSIAFTYNEPTIWVEYAEKVMRLAKKEGLKGVFVSSGYESKETLARLKDLIDGYNIDLKGATEEFYRQYTGTELKKVLKTIERLVGMGKWVEVTTMLIPGVNDSEKEVRWIARFLKGLSPEIPWHVTGFYPHYLMRNHEPTSYDRLRWAWEIGKEEGLKYVYTGNRPSWETESSFCPQCGNLLIWRQGWQVEVKGLREGKCEQCGAEIAGVWS